MTIVALRRLLSLCLVLYHGPSSPPDCLFLSHGSPRCSRLASRVCFIFVTVYLPVLINYQHLIDFQPSLVHTSAPPYYLPEKQHGHLDPLPSLQPDLCHPAIRFDLLYGCE